MKGLLTGILIGVVLSVLVFLLAVFSIWAGLIPSSTELFCFVRLKITVQSNVIARENCEEDYFQMHGHSKPDLLSAGLFCDMVGAERKLSIR